MFYYNNTADFFSDLQYILADFLKSESPKQESIF